MAKKDELNFENGNNMAGSEKLKALQAAMDKIEKSFGKGSIMKMGDESVEQVEVIPTGSIGLNVALGVGGYPRGRIIEIYGPESSGKTTLAIHAIAEAQKAGGIAAFIDAEHAFDRFYAAKLGVDVDNLLISQPDNGEQALEIAEQLIRSSAIDIIVVDSVAALTPKAEIEGTIPGRSLFPRKSRTFIRCTIPLPWYRLTAAAEAAAIQEEYHDVLLNILHSVQADFAGIPQFPGNES